MMNISCSSSTILHRIILLLLAAHCMVAQTFDSNKLTEPKYAKLKDRLFFLLEEEQLDSAFLLSAQLLSLSNGGHLNDEQTVDAYTTVSKVLNKLGFGNLHLQYVNKALQLYHEKEFENSHYLVDLWNFKAGIQHRNVKAFSETIDLYRKARRWNLENNHPLGASSTLNNIGLVYLNILELDSAEYYFLNAKKEFETARLPFREFVFSLNNNLAQVAFLQKKYSKAYNLYHLNYRLAHTATDGIKPIDLEKRKVTSSIGMMQVLLQQNNINAIDSLLTTAKKALSLLDFSRGNTLKEELFTVESEIQLKKGNIEAFYTTLQAKNRFTDSITLLRADNVTRFMEELVKLQLETSKANLEASEKELNYEFKQKTLTYILIIGALVIIALLVGLKLSFTSRHRQKAEDEKKLAEIALQNTELKKEKLSLQLKSQGRDLGELSSQLLLMRNLNKEVQQKLKKLRALKKEEQLEEMQSLTGLITRNVAENKVQLILQQHLDKVNNEFYQKLSKLATENLTKAEMEVCAMQRLNMDDKQIAELRGTTPNAVQVARYRIRKKLNLEKDILLDNYLKSL